MYFAIVAVTVAALSQLAQTTPLSSDAARVKLAGAAIAPAAHFPVRDLDSAVAEPHITSPSESGVRIEAVNATFPATLLLCSAANCLSGCFSFDLSTIPVNECLIDESSTFQSLAISQPSNAGLPFSVFVGPPGCFSFAQIPAVNTCFNANNGPFDDFFVEE